MEPDIDGWLMEAYDDREGDPGSNEDILDEEEV